MISREQVYALLALRNRGKGIFLPKPDGSSALAIEVIQLISDMHEGPEAPINIALRHAASGTTNDINILVEMINNNPDLLLQAGYVTTRGGIRINRVTLYEFFLGEGDPEGAKSIEFGFAKIPNGEMHRCQQCERYRPHIEALAKQIESKQPTYDLRPLINIIKTSTAADIVAALNKDMSHESQLQDAMCAFKNATRPPKELIKPGMHYQHYTTLMQAIDLLDGEWKKLSDNNTNNDKCDLVWGQIIKYLQISLPAIDRFGFARAFCNKDRTVNYEYRDGSLPDASRDDEELPGVDINEAIFGGCANSVGLAGLPRVLLSCGAIDRCCWGPRHVAENMSSKASNLQILCSKSHNSIRPEA